MAVSQLVTVDHPDDLPRRLCGGISVDISNKTHKVLVQAVTCQQVKHAIPQESPYDHTPSESLKQLLQDAQKRDRWFRERTRDLHDLDEPDRWTIQDGLLCSHHKVVVPDERAIRFRHMELYHDDPLAGHFGIEKNLEAVGTPILVARNTEACARMGN